MIDEKLRERVFAAAAAMGADEAADEREGPLLQPVDVSDIFTRPSPPPRYVWDTCIPRGEVTLLGAHGGTGKSFLALMLAVAVAAGRELLGVGTEHAPVLFASFEDNAAVLRHRLAFICRSWGIEPAELGLLRIVDGTAAPALYESTQRGNGATTATYRALRRLAREVAPGLIVVDNASDAFDGDEVRRGQVRGFIRALALMARECDSALLLLAHVDKNTSRAGAAENGEGYSGSTAWHNSARSRLFMARTASGLRLEHQKNNHGALREPLLLRWPDGGLLELDAPAHPFVQRIADENALKAVLRLIVEFTERGELVGCATTSRTHAGKLLRGQPAFPKHVRDAQLFDWLRDAERRELLARETARSKGRGHEREAWRVTEKGRAFAGIAPTAPTAPTAEVEAVGEGAPTAPTSLGGYGGKRARTKAGAVGAAEPSENATENGSRRSNSAERSASEPPF